MLERATRLCWMSPKIVTFQLLILPFRSRIVSASSRPCEGCSCVPSPALITGISKCRATKSAAPEAAWRITRQSGFMAFSVCTLSSSDSPFFRLDASACKFMVSAPSRDAAAPKLMRVRVERAKKPSATVFPRNAANFFSECFWISWNGLLCSRRKVSSSAVSGSRASRSRNRWVTFSLKYRHTPQFYPSSQQLAIDAVNKHHTLFAVYFAQPHLDDLGVAGLHHASGKLRLDGHLAMSAVDQHAKRNALRTAQVKKTVHRRANGAARVQDVVDQHQVHVVNAERNIGRLQHRVRRDL